MSPEFSELLCGRYPALYGSSFGFECEDGWSGLLDGLSEALIRQAEIAEVAPPRAQQVKEKLGSLRWYLGNSDYDRGAIWLAREMSMRVCERTGRSARLGSRSGWLATLAPGVEQGFSIRPEPGVPDLGTVTPEVIANLRANVFAGDLAVPVGWLDLVDGMLRQLGELSKIADLREQPRVSRVWREGVNELCIDYVGDDARVQGIIACAAALARRTSLTAGDVRLL